MLRGQVVHAMGDVDAWFALSGAGVGEGDWRAGAVAAGPFATQEAARTHLVRAGCERIESVVATISQARGGDTVVTDLIHLAARIRQS